MYCMHCGEQLPNEAKYCHRCGKAVEQTGSTYSYAYKKAKTSTDPKPGAKDGTYSYKKGDMPTRSAAGTEDGTYRHVYKNTGAGSQPTGAQTTGSQATGSHATGSQQPPPSSGTQATGSAKPPAGTGAKTPYSSYTKPRPAAPQSNSGCSGCLTWILVLAGLLCFYFWVFKPMAIDKGWFGMTEPTTAVAEEIEETQSPEEQKLAARAARLPGIREEFLDLPIFDNRLGGPCKDLDGFVGITVLFVDDGESYWTQEKMDEFLWSVYQVRDELKSEAAGWGKSLDFIVQSTHCSVTDIVVPSIANYSLTAVLSGAGYSSNQAESLEQLKAETFADSVPVIVAFNKQGRSFACPIGGDFSQVEACYIFDDPSAIKHELLHLFGAADFYYHDYMDWSVGQYLGDSIMASTGGPVDDMTAYLIGWTDTLTEDANMFLYAAGAVGTEGLEEAKEENKKSGYGTITLGEGAVYTGMLSLGTPNGTGEISWPNGDRYNGDWNQGQRTGYGTYYWANGNVYQGYFQDGNMHGQGTMTYYNGQVRSGYWENGNFVG